MEYEISKCKIEEIEEVGRLYDKVTLYLESHVNYPKWVHGDYPSLGSAKVAFENDCLYTVKSEVEVVCAFVLNDDPQGDYDAGDWRVNLKVGEYMVIHSLAVPNEYAGQGIGGRVVKFCLATAKERGYKGVRVDVVPGNFPARNLYEKWGFTYAGEKDLKRGFDEIPTFQLLEYNF